MEQNEIAMSLLISMNRFNDLIKIINNKKFKTENTLTERQFFALTSINKYNKIELKNLSKDLYVSTSSLCILLNKLVEKGYVYREENQKDRRNTFYGITEQGKLVLKSEVEEVVEIINKKLKNLNNEDLNRLEDVIKIMSAAKENGLEGKVTSIDISNKNEYSIYLEEEKKKVHLGDNTNFSNKMLYVVAIIEEEKEKEGDIFVNGDLNNKFQPYFREKV